MRPAPTSPPRCDGCGERATATCPYCRPQVYSCNECVPICEHFDIAFREPYTAAEEYRVMGDVRQPNPAPVPLPASGEPGK